MRLILQRGTGAVFMQLACQCGLNGVDRKTDFRN
jgi:hypothetical protein